MIDPPKRPELTNQPGSTRQDSNMANPADAHAMDALLRKPASGDELSSLFSSQTKRVARDANNRTGTDDLEQKLRRYEEDKGGEQDRGQQQQQEENLYSPEDLAREVAEHILISDKEYMDQGAGNEIRIKIKDTILKDAHVHLVREPDCLQVKLISSDEQSVQTLVAARHSLEKQLEKNYTGLIKITIVHLNRKGDAQTSKNEYQ
jgi:hypothetical protein